MKKNDLIDMYITSITSDGNGIGRFNSMVIFVPNTAVGDKIQVRILKVKKNYCYGKIEKILTASSCRIKVDCETYLSCGGCCFRHISYNAELKIKEQIVKDCLLRIAKLDKNNLKQILTPIIGADNIYHYRNKAQIPIRSLNSGDIVSGFFSLHSHRIIPINSCNLHPLIFDEIIKEIKLWMLKNKVSTYNEETQTGIIRHIYLRIAENTNEIMLCLIINSDNLKNTDSLINNLIIKFSTIKSIILNFNKKNTNVILGPCYKTIFGKNYIKDILCGLKFYISPQSFYQVNHSQTEKLYSIVKEYADLKGDEKILDLFCGIGTIGLTLASNCQKLLGIEIIPSAIQNAKTNAKINNILNAQFVCSDADSISQVLNKYNFHPDIIIIDPPRKGCSIKLISAISAINPKKIIYVSCNPSTLARDIALFSKFRFYCQQATPVEMFPKTFHVETVCLLSKAK